MLDEIWNEIIEKTKIFNCHKKTWERSPECGDKNQFKKKVVTSSRDTLLRRRSFIKDESKPFLNLQDDKAGL